MEGYGRRFLTRGEGVGEGSTGLGLNKRTGELEGSTEDYWFRGTFLLPPLSKCRRSGGGIRFLYCRCEERSDAAISPPIFSLAFPLFLYAPCHSCVPSRDSDPLVSDLFSGLFSITPFPSATPESCFALHGPLAL